MKANDLFLSQESISAPVVMFTTYLLKQASASAHRAAAHSVSALPGRCHTASRRMASFEFQFQSFSLSVQSLPSFVSLFVAVLLFPSESAISFFTRSFFSFNAASFCFCYSMSPTLVSPAHKNGATSVSLKSDYLAACARKLLCSYLANLEGGQNHFQ